MAAAMSAAGHQSTQLRYWNGFDLAARRGDAALREVHVDNTAVVSKFERAAEQLQ